MAGIENGGVGRLQSRRIFLRNANGAEEARRERLFVGTGREGGDEESWHLRRHGAASGCGMHRHVSPRRGPRARAPPPPSPHSYLSTAAITAIFLTHQVISHRLSPAALVLHSRVSHIASPSVPTHTLVCDCRR